MKLTIVNLIATLNLNTQVDLSSLVKLNIATYHPTKYPCAYIKLPQTKGKVSVFRNGKLISIGTQSFHDAASDLKYVSNLITRIQNKKLTETDAKLRNLICLVDMESQLDLQTMAQTLEAAMYEPEQFPGIIWHPEEFQATMLVFSSGKIVASGLKSIDDLNKLQLYLETKLKPYIWPKSNQ